MIRSLLLVVIVVVVTLVCVNAIELSTRATVAVDSCQECTHMLRECKQNCMDDVLKSTSFDQTYLNACVDSCQEDKVACSAAIDGCDEEHHNEHEDEILVMKVVPEPIYQSMFTSFVKQYKKKYTHDEFFPRYSIFKSNVNKIRHHNAGKHTFTMGLNEFADMTFTEFHSSMTGYNNIDDAVHRAANSAPEPSQEEVDAAPTSIDWRTQNAVTPIRNQGQCGACWAFSSSGAVEGAFSIARGTLTSLSVQQLVDCSTQGNSGCQGGLMDYAFQYIISNGGITNDASYPYKGVGGTCNQNVQAAATISSFTDVKVGSENSLITAVLKGPVSVAIEADQSVFQFYKSGVLSSAACGTQLDHGVLAVGYGVDAMTKQKYWLVKNSWGTSWGEKGYIRMIRGKNECGIAQQASYPVV